MDCDHCGRSFDSLEYTCRRCGGSFCTKCRLPETHECIGLKVEKAERALKREEGENEPWFKDEFRLSNVGEDEKRSTPRGQTHPADIKSESESECETCGKSLLDHEIAGCPHCGEVYCGEHVAAHRSQCSERSEPTPSTRDRQTRRDQLEAEQKERYRGPDVNADGTVATPEYEDEIANIADTSAETDGRSRYILFVALVLVLLGVTVVIMGVI